jgi:hypothetical protein
MSNAHLKSFVDEQLKKWGQLKQFMDDPATTPVIEQLIAAAQNNKAVTAIPHSAPSPKARKKGAFISKIEEACKTFSGPGEHFTVRNVIVQYEQLGYVFGASDKLVAANSALKRLVKKGKIELVEKGSGHTPSTYKLPQRFPRLVGNEKVG